MARTQASSEAAWTFFDLNLRTGMLTLRVAVVQVLTTSRLKHWFRVRVKSKLRQARGEAQRMWTISMAKTESSNWDKPTLRPQNWWKMVQNSVCSSRGDILRISMVHKHLKGLVNLWSLRKSQIKRCLEKPFVFDNLKRHSILWTVSRCLRM